MRLRPNNFQAYLSPEEQEQLNTGQYLEGSRRFLGIAFDTSRLSPRLPTQQTLIAIDEPEQCRAHSDRWVEHAQEQLTTFGS